MQQRKRTFFRPLLLVLMLVIGPVHAQIVLACAAMDMVMHGDCSCDDYKKDKDCVDSGFDATVDSDGNPCCELSVEFNVNKDTRHDKPIVKPAEARSDVDQPQTIVALFNPIEPPRAFAIPRVIQSPLPTPSRCGSDTYLITQRLRI